MRELGKTFQLSRKPSRSSTSLHCSFKASTSMTDQYRGVADVRFLRLVLQIYAIDRGEGLKSRTSDVAARNCIFKPRRFSRQKEDRLPRQKLVMCFVTTLESPGVLRAWLTWESLGQIGGKFLRLHFRQPPFFQSSKSLRLFAPSISPTKQRRFTKLLITSTASIHTVDDVVFALSEKTLTRCWAPGFDTGSFRLQ